MSAPKASALSRIEEKGRAISEILTPVYGGHVWDGTWEALQAVDSASCCACGESIRRYGCPVRHVPNGDTTEPNLCQGWQFRFPFAVLPRLVRGMIREAPDDKPNGPSEEAIEALHAAHLKVIEWPGREGNVPREGAAIERLTHSLADDARALRLALEHDERSAT